LQAAQAELAVERGGEDGEAPGCQQPPTSNCADQRASELPEHDTRQLACGYVFVSLRNP